jgi:hypothetical protein
MNCRATLAACITNITYVKYEPRQQFTMTANLANDTHTRRNWNSKTLKSLIRTTKPYLKFVKTLIELCVSDRRLPTRPQTLDIS